MVLAALYAAFLVPLLAADLSNPSGLAVSVSWLVDFSKPAESSRLVVHVGTELVGLACVLPLLRGSLSAYSKFKDPLLVSISILSFVQATHLVTAFLSTSLLVHGYLFGATLLSGLVLWLFLPSVLWVAFTVSFGGGIDVKRTGRVSVALISASLGCLTTFGSALVTRNGLLALLSAVVVLTWILTSTFLLLSIPRRRTDAGWTNTNWTWHVMVVGWSSAAILGAFAQLALVGRAADSRPPPVVETFLLLALATHAWSFRATFRAVKLAILVPGVPPEHLVLVVNAWGRFTPASNPVPEK
ncbi:MAG: hypothetical protein Kow0069_29680 [Promethearchaeota archaeon]